MLGEGKVLPPEIQALVDEVNHIDDRCSGYTVPMSMVPGMQARARLITGLLARFPNVDDSNVWVCMNTTCNWTMFGEKRPICSMCGSEMERKRS